MFIAIPTETNPGFARQSLLGMNCVLGRSPEPAEFLDRVSGTLCTSSSLADAHQALAPHPWSDASSECLWWAPLTSPPEGEGRMSPPPPA